MKRIISGLVGIISLLGGSVFSQTLTTQEVAQIESALGITLPYAVQTNLAAIVKPASSSWRTAAESRIAAHRKANLTVQVVDSQGTPVPGADVAVRLKKNAFKFGGIVDVQDLTDASGNLSGAGQTTNYWQRVTTNLFNAVGANNGFKPKITGQHAYLPGFISWATNNNLDVRGHLLIWPGGGDVADLGGTPGVDFGDHLSTASTSAYAHYNVLGAVTNYAGSARGAADKAALKAVVDAEIAEWAGRWGVYEWDVANETSGNTLLQQILGYDQMAVWFQIAQSNKVNPRCGLLINEFKIISADHTDGGTSYNSRKNTYMSRINTVISGGGPLTGIGFQSRFNYGHIDPATVYSRLDDFATAYTNLNLVGTEFEMTGKNGYTYTENERAQMTEEILTVYYSHDQVTGLNAWDAIADNTEATHLAYYDGTIKLNGLVWYYLHRIRYHTGTNQATDSAGQIAVNGYKGDYDITVTYAGSEYPAVATLSSNGTVQVVLNDVVYNSHTSRTLPSDDTYVSQNASTTAYGSDATMRVRGQSSRIKNAYVKFAVTNLTASLESAKLRLYSVDVAEALTIYRTDTAWAESTLTYNTQPATGALITNITATAANWIEVDVSAIVTNNGSYAFVIKRPGTSANDRQLSSKEGTHAPQLVLTVNSAPEFSGTPVSAPNAEVGAAYSGSLTNWVSDSHGDPIQFTKLAGGAAWLSVATNGTLGGTPSSTGVYTWQIKAEDSRGAASTGTLQIAVVPANQPPLWDSNLFTLTGATASYAFSQWINGRASDPEGDPMTFAVTGGPGWLIVSTNGQVTGTPAQADAGTNTFTVSVQSGAHSAVEATMKIIVAPVEADIDHWTFNDAAGTKITNAVNTTGTTLFTADTAGMQTDGSGLLVITNPATQYNGNSGDLTIGARTNGIYELEFLVNSFNLSSGDSNGANVGFGFRDSGRDLFLVRLNKTASGVVLSTQIDGVYTLVDTLGSGVYTSAAPLKVRCKIDLDADTADIYTTIGAGPENWKKQVSLSTNQVWNQLVYKVVNVATDWGASDYMKIDYLKVRKVDLDNYYLFAGAFNWNGETATAESDDPDGDGVGNFYEYALGGNPIVADAHAVLPKISVSGGTAYTEFKLGVDSADIRYTLEYSDDLSDWVSIPPAVVHGAAGTAVKIPTPNIPVCFVRLKVNSR